MRIDIITVLPELLESPFNHSIVKRAKDKNAAMRAQVKEMDEGGELDL